MHAIEVEKPADRRSCLVEKPRAIPGPGEVVIKAEAIGVNFVDTYFRRAISP